MRKMILFALAFFVLLGGCATPRSVLKTTPAWYEEPPNADAEWLYVVAVGESRDMSLATNKAKLQGRAELAQQMATKVQNLEKRFQEEVGTGTNSEILEEFSSVTKTVTSETLHGAREEKKETQQLENGIFRVYVLMGLPIGEGNAKLMERIKANETLYTRFRATKAYEELEKEVKAYEEARNNP